MFRMWMIPVTVLCLCILTGATEKVVHAHVGTTARLNCRVDTELCGPLHSVKWYRDTSRIYVFSHVGSIARAEGDATNRMTVEYSDAMNASLKIEQVRIEDDATYKCEITYLEVREHCDVVQIVKLITLAKPESVRIFDSSNGNTLQNATTLPPLVEGTDLDLICEARRGKPIPKVRWFNGTREIKRAHYTATDEGDGLGTGSAKLQVTLSKGDLLAQFLCKVESEALEEPTITWITPDVHVRPSGMRVYGVKGHVVQGTDVRIRCDVVGARPAAKITWYNMSTVITNETLQQSNPDGNPHMIITEESNIDGTYTTNSTLFFRVSRWEDRKAFHCYAQNEVLGDDEPALHSLMVLEVQFPPEIKVNPPVITTNESSNILLLCHYFANPQQLVGVVWAKDGNNLTLRKDKYEGATLESPSLVINNVSRDDMGEYKCLLENSVGSEESKESILLNVLFPPTVEVAMEPSTPVKAADKGNVTLVCNVTSGNPSTLLKVGWYLGGELIKILPECNYTSYDDTGNGEGSGGPLCEIDPSILSLERVDESFAGNYTCQGKNAAGWGDPSDPNELIVYYPPAGVEITYSPEKVIKDRSVNLTCKVAHYGRPHNITYLWYRGNLRIEDVTTKNLSIPQVKSMDKNNYTCAAENAGGRSTSATIFLNVSAPPKFIQALDSFKGILYNAQNISLTCRVECSPLCPIGWKKDGELLDTLNSPLYYVVDTTHPPQIEKNDFESIESTLYWNMTAWPNHELKKLEKNYTKYTCQSRTNGRGPAVNSTIAIAVDYPPEMVEVSNHFVRVTEGDIPELVTCQGHGSPSLDYKWKRGNSTKHISETAVLRLEPLRRQDGGYYICEASNKYGIEEVKVYFNVQYAPDCSIQETRRNGDLALECTAYGNPQEVTFRWSLQHSNETLDKAYTQQEGSKSYLYLEADETAKVYVCRANNTIGEGTACERRVDANIPWWKQMKWIIILASALALIVCFLIICIVIILYCRRRRSHTKYSNPLEMEEREKFLCTQSPDVLGLPLVPCGRLTYLGNQGQSPQVSGQPRWPLKPGVLVHVNKSHNLSQLTPEATPFKVTSVPSRYRRNKSKFYARLGRLRELIAFRGHAVPRGITESASGVVTYKKFNPPAATSKPDVAASRKRKKPGLAPNPSSTGDKTRLGALPPIGFLQNPPNDSDKGFYENLPFHGMQNPPNKPISIIAPFTQGRALDASSSTKSLLPRSNFSSTNTTPFGSCSGKSIKRNQSFHGFQTNHGINWHAIQTANICRNLSNPNINAQLSQNSLFNPHTWSGPKPVEYFKSAYLFPPPAQLQRPYSFSNGNQQSLASLHHSQMSLLNCRNLPHLFGSNNPFSVPPRKQRILGRKESDVRKSTVGTTNDKLQLQILDHSDQDMGHGKRSMKSTPDGESKTDSDPKSDSAGKKLSVAEIRFSSLELRKHKCYSPTFYSVRCKKHAKKRPVVYALPKKVFGESPLFRTGSDPITTPKDSASADGFVSITESIKVMEHNNEQGNSCERHTPVPAPRCRKHRKVELIYQNISHVLKGDRRSNSDPSGHQLSLSLDSSMSMINDSKTSNESLDAPVDTCVTEVQIHRVPERNVSDTSDPSSAKISSRTDTSDNTHHKSVPLNVRPKPRRNLPNNKNKIKVPSVSEVTNSNDSANNRWGTNAKCNLDSSKSSQVPLNLPVGHGVMNSSFDLGLPSSSNCYTSDSLHSTSAQRFVDRFNRLNLADNSTKCTSSAPKLVGVSPKKGFMSAGVFSPTTTPSMVSQVPVLKCSPNFVKPKVESPKGALSRQIQARKKSPNPSLKDVPQESNSDDNTKESFPLIPQMPILDTPNKWSSNLTHPQNAFYTLTTPHYKQVTAGMAPQYSATIPHPTKHAKLIPRTLFSDHHQQQQQQPVSKSKSFSSKPKQKKHFQIPIQKCHSFKFQTAESYFQPIKNIHEEDFMRNGYVSDYGEGSRNRHHQGRPHNKRDKQKTKGPLVLRGSTDYQDSARFHQNPPVQLLKYPQPLLARASHGSNNKPNGVVYADLDMPKPNNNGKKSSQHDASSAQLKPSRSKSKTEYATLKFNDIGQEIDV